MSFARFTVVLDACTIFPMIVRDVLLTLAGHEFFNPKWSPRIREEWMRNFGARMAAKDSNIDWRTKAERIARDMDTAFPDAAVDAQAPESEALQPVHAKDRHVVLTAIVAQADAILTFNIRDFAPAHLLEELQIEVLHPDDFVLDLIDLNEKRAAVAFRELRGRKTRPPWTPAELARRVRESGLVQTSIWLSSKDVTALI